MFWVQTICPAVCFSGSVAAGDGDDVGTVAANIDAVSGKDNTPVTIVQWLRFGGASSLRIIGSSPRDDWTKAFSRFRAVRDGIQPR